MVADGAFVDGADGLEGQLGFLVGGVGFEAYAEQVERVEGVGELEELGFGVDAGAAPGAGQPGVADFYRAVLEVEVEETSRAYELVGLTVAGFLDGDPGQRTAGIFGVERCLDPTAKVSRGLNFE